MGPCFRRGAGKEAGAFVPSVIPGSVHHPREGGDPGRLAQRIRPLDACLRRHDGLGGRARASLTPPRPGPHPAPLPSPRAPANAGAHSSERVAGSELWIPAFAGMRD